jgi:PBSX family phage terminase large subunit
MKEKKLAILSDYHPHKNAKLFHSSSGKDRIITASVRSGKTWAAIHEICKVAWNNKTNDVVLIIAPTYSQLKDILMRPLFYKLLSYGLVNVNGWNKSDSIIQLKNGKLIYGRSNESYLRLEGINVYETFVDEVCRLDKECIEECKRRMITTNGRLNLIGTPKGKLNWVYQDYFENGQREDTDYFHFDIYDNPLVKKEAVNKLLSQYDELTARQEIWGEWVSLFEDRVYKSFDKEIHLKEPDMINDLYIGIDWNQNIYASVVMTKIGNKLYVIDEFANNKDVIELGQKIYNKYGDNAYIITDSMNSQSNRILLRQCGLTKIYETASNPKRTDRYMMVNAWIKNALGNINLYVSPKCINLIKDLETLEFKKNSDIPNDMGNKLGHWSDALGYVIWNNFKIDPNEHLIKPNWKQIMGLK